MNEPVDIVAQLLTEVILPNLKAAQASQQDQIEANIRLEEAIEELRLHLNSQFTHLAAQLTACRAEIAAVQATLQAERDNRNPAHQPSMVH